ncbi:hypothetical protein [Solitalea lacus]|uniref:hypothetical protein n=1 Tax=Solitalea lacus TaxID=2911172 RepID=UPI001EDAF0E9|nr:hypothetical protein [Solitalea lacus]UKJ07965.1 hypothetical protein L2B55_02075 [Solitalea lacus]
MENSKLVPWAKLSLLSIVIVALYGMIMRYKIAFDFPYLNQKNLLIAHFHFAIIGWVSHLLYSNLLLGIQPYLPSKNVKKYNRLIVANLLSAFGMLGAFTIKGYGPVSFTFYTFSVVIALVFTVFYIKEVGNFPIAYKKSRPWAVTGLLLNVVSSVGPLTLVYMMVTKHIHQELYLASVYYYLHFQYSGWFFFGTMAIVLSNLPVENLPIKKYFQLFAFTVFPTYFLSTLWAKIPLWLYVVTVIATLLQLAAWISLLVKLMPIFSQMKQKLQYRWLNVFFYVAALALTIKFILQTISIIPQLSQLVFGFRPIVIAYLHLVFLGVYSLFFVGYLFAKGFIYPSKIAMITAFAFLTGVFLNELLLAIQGFAAFAYIPIPFVNEMLFGIAVLLWGSALGLLLSQFKEQ